MHFPESLSFAVGRYGAYIWPAYAITAALLGGLIVQSLLSARRWKATAERLQREAEASRKSGGK